MNIYQWSFDDSMRLSYVPLRPLTFSNPVFPLVIKTFLGTAELLHRRGDHDPLPPRAPHVHARLPAQGGPCVPHGQAAEHLQLRRSPEHASVPGAHPGSYFLGSIDCFWLVCACSRCVLIGWLFGMVFFPDWFINIHQPIRERTRQWTARALAGRNGSVPYAMLVVDRFILFVFLIGGLICLV